MSHNEKLDLKYFSTQLILLFREIRLFVQSDEHLKISFQFAQPFLLFVRIVAA